MAVLKDGPAREEIASELDTTFVVEAAAGTGKTTSLVTRMIALIREGKTEVGHIAAITFTRKAAAHLRQKFQTELERSCTKEQSPSHSRLLRDALADIDRCYVGTVHSFCARLLRERPVEAGIDPQFEEIDKAENARMADKCWVDYTHRLHLLGDPIITTLNDIRVGLTDLKSVYILLSSYPDVEPAVPMVGPPEFESTRKQVKAFLDMASNMMPDTVPDSGWDALQTLVRRANRLWQVLDASRNPQFTRILEVMDKSAKVVQNRWPDKGQAKQLGDDYILLRDTVIRPALVRWREYLYPILMTAVRPAVDEFKMLRMETGKLNYQDLLMIARDLLRDNPHVRRYFQTRYSHLLVDEFQDTDPIQAEIVFYLTGQDTDERSWRKITPIAGSLFIVGDPKQSIYRFRRADITTYNLVKSLIEQSGGKTLELSSNFRSVGHVCRWVNDFFEDVFPEGGSEHQARRAPMDPYRPDGDEGCGIFSLETIYSEAAPTGGKAANPSIATLDAAKIARWIRSALDAPLQVTEEVHGETLCRDLHPGDILIITRQKPRLSLYAKALESEGVPYEVTGGGAFSDSEELAALLPFLKAVVDPDDPVSLVAYLRGQLCGLDDDALYCFKRDGGHFSYLSDVPTDTDARILDAFTKLREARTWSQHLPPAAALGRIMAGLGLIAYAAARDFGYTRAGNLLKALTVSRSASADGLLFSDVVDQLEDLLSDIDQEEMGLEPGTGGKVRLMNLHKAKGLEAPVVFLADPVPLNDYEPTYHTDRSVDPPLGHFLIYEKKFNHIREIARPFSWDTTAKIEELYDDAEENRLLYVAATRAMNTLVVSIYKDRDGRVTDAQPWSALEPLIDRSLPEIDSANNAHTPQQLPSDLSGQLLSARDEIAAQWQEVMSPSYSSVQTTRIAHGPSGTGGYKGGVTGGAAYGRVMHSLLDALMKDGSVDIRKMAQNLMREEELPPDELDNTLEIVEAVRSSDLWRAACDSPECYTEVPFSICVPSAQIGISGGPVETLLNGCIDLAFRKNGKWTIVDYKSDQVQENLAQLKLLYTPQVRCYARYWQKLTGEPTESFLYFIRTLECVQVDSV